MAWSKRSKNYGEERASGEGADWIHATSVDEAIETVRKHWKEKGPHAEGGDWPLIQLAHIAVMRGLTRRVAPLVVRLLERREAEGKLRWHLEGNLIGAVGISIVRLLAAHVEDPSIPAGKARDAVALFLRSIEPHDDLRSVPHLMPLITAARLDAPPPGFVPGRRASKLPLRTDMAASGMCAAAHRQWRVEYLLAMGAEDEALELAHKGRSEKPCGETCAFAPHSMYAWLLVPLHLRGRKDEARVLHDRLETLMVPRVLYLNAMGHRIHYLALEGRFEDAGSLMRTMLPMAAEPDASPWQKLRFFAGCAKAAELISSREQMEEFAPGGEDALVRARHDELAALFANRGI